MNGIALSDAIRRATQMGSPPRSFCVCALPIFKLLQPRTNSPTGRLDFEAANLPTANVEVDLSQAMFKDLFGIGDAAIAGVAEASSIAGDGTDADKKCELRRNSWKLPADRATRRQCRPRSSRSRLRKSARGHRRRAQACSNHSTPS